MQKMAVFIVAARLGYLLLLSSLHKLYSGRFYIGTVQSFVFPVSGTANITADQVLYRYTVARVKVAQQIANPKIKMQQSLAVFQYNGSIVLVLCCPNGNFPMENSCRFPGGKPAATESRYQP